MKNKYLIIFLAALMVAFMPSCKKSGDIKTLIITGQNDHNWMVSSEAIKQILDETGLFATKIVLTPVSGGDMSDFSPRFSKYDLVVVDYKGDKWPEGTTASLMDYVNNGGGLVLYNPGSDPALFKSDSVWLSERQNFEIRTQIVDHPVTKGLSVKWFHLNDVIVRGVSAADENVMVLATTSTGGQFQGGRRPIPVLAAKAMGQGRIFATMIGTPDEKENQALHCAGAIVTLQRGAEWAATGAVTQEVPFDFPTAAGAVTRPDFTGVDFDEAFLNLGSYDIRKSTLYFTWLQSQIRKASGDAATLLELEKKMVEVLINSETTVDARKLILRELSWMGTDYCIPEIKKLSGDADLEDDIAFALERLQ